MKLINVSKKKIETVEFGQDVGLYVNNLGVQIAISAIIEGWGGFIAVDPEIPDLQAQLEKYLAEGSISIYITGGRNTDANRVYSQKLGELFGGLQTRWIGDFHIENHANEEIHLDGLTLLGKAIPNIGHE